MIQNNELRTKLYISKKENITNQPIAMNEVGYILGGINIFVYNLKKLTNHSSIAIIENYNLNRLEETDYSNLKFERIFKSGKVPKNPEKRVGFIMNCVNNFFGLMKEKTGGAHTNVRLYASGRNSYQIRNEFLHKFIEQRNNMELKNIEFTTEKSDVIFHIHNINMGDECYIITWLNIVNPELK